MMVLAQLTRVRLIRLGICLDIHLSTASQNLNLSPVSVNPQNRGIKIEGKVQLDEELRNG
jgi:hypothetical protein